MRTPRFRAVPALLLLALTLAACTEWHPATAPAPTASERTLRLTLDDGAVMVLEGATVFGDSVRGRRVDRRAGLDEDVSLPLSRVRRVETRSTNAFKSIVVAAGVAAAVFAGFVATLLLTGDFD